MGENKENANTVWACYKCWFEKKVLRGEVFRYYPKGPPCHRCEDEMRLRDKS